MSDLTSNDLAKKLSKKASRWAREKGSDFVAEHIEQQEEEIQNQAARIKELERQLEIQTNVNGHMAESNRDIQNIILSLQDKPNTTN